MATFVTRRRAAVTLGALVCRLLSPPAADLRLGLPGDGTKAESSSARTVWDPDDPA